MSSRVLYWIALLAPCSGEHSLFWKMLQLHQKKGPVNFWLWFYCQDPDEDWEALQGLILILFIPHITRCTFIWTISWWKLHMARHFWCTVSISSPGENILRVNSFKDPKICLKNWKTHPCNANWLKLKRISLKPTQISAGNIYILEALV